MLLSIILTNFRIKYKYTKGDDFISSPNLLYYLNECYTNHTVSMFSICVELFTSALTNDHISNRSL